MAGLLNGALIILALGLSTQGLFVGTVFAGRVAVISAEGDSVDMVEVGTWVEVESSSRDSLMVEIRRYSRMIGDMRDSRRRS